MRVKGERIESVCKNDLGSVIRLKDQQEKTTGFCDLAKTT